MDHLTLWYRALASPHGISIKSDEPDRLRSALYIARKKAADPELAALSLHWSPRDPNELWIVKRNEKEHRATAEGESQSISR